MKIPKRQLAKWIEALRSGKYSQGREALQSKEGFCCLGVACKVLIPENDLQLQRYSGALRGILPTSQLSAPNWLEDINTDFAEKTGKYLSQLNDKARFTFDEIADCLEAVYVHKVLR